MLSLLSMLSTGANIPHTARGLARATLIYRHLAKINLSLMKKGYSIVQLILSQEVLYVFSNLSATVTHYAVTYYDGLAICPHQRRKPPFSVVSLGFSP